MRNPNHHDTQTERAVKFDCSDYVNVYSLSNSAATVTIPSGFTTAVFSSTGNFYANFNGGTASATAKTDGTGSEINPTSRWVKSTAGSFSIFSPQTVTVSVAFYN